MYKRSILSLPLMLLAQPALAASWQVVPRVSGESLYETNAGLATDGEQDGYSGQVTVALEARRETQRTEVYIAPRVQVARFLDDDLDPLDRESYFLDAGVDHELQRANIGLRARASRQPTYRSELDLSIPDDVDDVLPSAGGDLTILDDEQTTWNLRPYWSYQLSPRDTLRLTASYTDVEYEETGLLSPRFDYRDIGLTAGWERTLTPRSSLVLEALASDYKADRARTNNENESESVGASIGYRWQASEISTFQINLGIAETDQEISGPNVCTDPAEIAAGLICTVDTKDTSLTGEARWRLRSERNNLMLSVSRAVRPSSNGNQQERLQARAFLRRTITQRLDGTVGLIASKQENVDDRNNLERTFLSAELAVAWRLAPQWSVTAGYRFIGRESEAAGTTFEDFANDEVRLGITWEGLRR